MPDVGVVAEDAYIQYSYARFGDYGRNRQIKLVNSKHEPISVNGRVFIIFPYFSVLDRKSGDYWKWTKAYSKRFDWYYYDSSMLIDTDGIKIVIYGNGQEIKPNDDFGFCIEFGTKGGKTRIDEGVLITLDKYSAHKKK